LTAWFAGLVLQTVLVRARRVDVHRRIGWGLAVVALAVAATGVWITLGTVSALSATGFNADTVQALAPRIAWGNYSSALTFAFLVGAAVLSRRHSEAHKRLMLLASIAIISPALARILRWPVFGPELNEGFAMAAIVGVFALAGVVAAYDVITRRRLHAATAVGVIVIVGVKLLAVLFIAQSAVGRALVPGLT
jgi:hypothetical protein